MARLAFVVGRPVGRLALAPMMSMRTLTFVGCIAALLAVCPAPADAEDDDPETTETSEAEVPPPPDPARSSEQFDRLHATQSVLEWTAGGSLLVTSTLGSILYENRPHIGSEGRCHASGPPLLGTFGCDGLTNVHGGFAVLTVGAYVGAGTMKVLLPDRPDGPRASAFTGPLVPFHIGAVSLMPVLGVTAAAFDDHHGQVPTTVRDIHHGLGFVTVALYAASYFFDG